MSRYDHLCTCDSDGKLHRLSCGMFKSTLEERGDFVLTITGPMWNNSKVRTQRFFDAMAGTDSVYPTIVIVNRDTDYNADLLRHMLRDDPQYQKPGLLVIRLDKDNHNNTKVSVIEFLEPQPSVPEFSDELIDDVVKWINKPGGE